MYDGLFSKNGSQNGEVNLRLMALSYKVSVFCGLSEGSFNVISENLIME
jgi:hypothetical protein